MWTRLWWRVVRRRAVPAAVLAGALALSAPAGAAGEELHTSQATRAGADASTWAPMPAKPAAICLVDSGVDPIPDTSSVIARYAVDDGGGLDVSPGKHGTQMAMVAAAPRDGWGMVGIAPGQPIVSVRAQVHPGRFYFDDYRRALLLCQQKAGEHNIRVVNMSLGAQGTPVDSTIRALADVVDGVRARGISVVAAAGNQPGPVETPANYPPILSVAAGASGGQLCDFAAGGPDQSPPADLIAPGCQLDVAMPDTGAPAWAHGSSHATAIVSAALAQLYSHRPDLTPDEAEQLLLDYATVGPGGRALNVAAAWRGAGLEAQLAAGAVARPPLPPPPAPPAPPEPPRPSQPAPREVPGFIEIPPPSIERRVRAQWRKPRAVRLVCRRGIVRVVARKPPARARLVVIFSGPRRGGEFSRWTRRAASRNGKLRVRLARPWDRVQLQHRGPGRTASAQVTLRAPRRCKPPAVSRGRAARYGGDRVRRPERGLRRVGKEAR